jgi:peptide-methionine (S)-S-oxide reductase
MDRVGIEVALLGGGCFWCLEAVYQELKGVTGIVSGYAGGHVPNPTYEAICGKRTGHAEVVRVSFDPGAITYREVLEVFFAIHDPTTPDQQGNDIGPQYRSVIFAMDAGQLETARAVVAELEAERVFEAPIVTEVLPAPEFYPAEDYHQNYYRLHGSQPYCAFVISPKLSKFRKKFAEKRVPGAG